MVDAEHRLLQDMGHTVLRYQRSNAELAQQTGLKTATQALWNRQTTREIALYCANFQPDLIHVHNTFPLISPAFIHFAAAQQIPVVQTLHNFRLLCAQAMLLREGQDCQSCIGHLPWRAIIHRCYHASLSQSLIAAGVICLHRRLATYQDKVAQFIVPSQFCRDKFIVGGLPKDRLQVKAHFSHPPAAQQCARQGGLYVGRLAPEKGLTVLSNALNDCPDVTMRLAGSGPQEDIVRERFGAHYLGPLNRTAILAWMHGVRYMVAPSICLETFGMSLIEAFSCATPVIASRHGAYAELIRDGQTGLLFTPGDAQDLAEKIRWAENHPHAMQAMGDAARLDYEKNYTPQMNYQRLMEIYESALGKYRAPQSH